MKTQAAMQTLEVPIQENQVPAWVMPAVIACVVLVDIVLTLVCFASAFVIREGMPIVSPSAWAWSSQFVPYSGILFFAVPARLGMLIYERVYRFGGAFSYVNEMLRIFKAILVSSLLIVGWAFLFRGGFAFREFSYSRAVFVVDFALALAFFVTFHLGLRFIQSLVRQRGINLIPTLVVGTNKEAIQTIRELAERKYLGYRVIGAVGTANDIDSEGKTELGLTIGDCPILGKIDELADLIRKYRIQEVIITDDSVQSEALFEAMMQIGRKRRVEFRFAPKLFNILPQKTSVDQIGILPMVRLFREPLSDAERFVKRFSDLLIAAVAAVCLFPAWLIITLLVRFDSPGQVLFKQERVGMDGRLFLCYKFRTMASDSDETLHRDMYLRNIEGKIENDADNDNPPVFGKVKDDPRITRVGKWLRRTSVDELPQILNVLRGEMSIVGPRPPIPYEVEEYDIWHRKRLDMRPGMTGLWQVSGRNRLTFDEMVKVDLFYIENWSLLLDLKIIFLTVPAVFRGDGAR